MNAIETLNDCLKLFNRESTTTYKKPVKVDVEYDLFQDWNKVYPSISKAGIYAIFDDDKNLLHLEESSHLGISWSKFVQYDEDCIRYKIMDSRFSKLRYMIAIMPSDASEKDIAAIKQFLLERLAPLIPDL